MPTPEQVRAAVDGYVAAYRAGDRDAFLALWADGATIEDPVGTPVHEGAEAIGAFWDLVHGMTDRLVLEPTHVHVCEAEAAMVFEIRSTVGGQDMVIDAVDVFVVDDDGRLGSMRAYWEFPAARPAG